MQKRSALIASTDGNKTQGKPVLSLAAVSARYALVGLLTSEPHAAKAFSPSVAEKTGGRGNGIQINGVHSARLQRRGRPGFTPEFPVYRPANTRRPITNALVDECSGTDTSCQPFQEMSSSAVQLTHCFAKPIGYDGGMSLPRPIHWLMICAAGVCVAVSIYGNMVTHPLRAAEGNENPRRNQLEKGEGYDKVKDFKDAVSVLKQQLEADGKPQYAALISEKSVLAGLQKSIKTWDSWSPRPRAGVDSIADFWHDKLKPAFLRITENGEWPAGCYFIGLYDNISTVDGVAIDNLGVIICLGPKQPPGSQFKTFGLEVIRVSFGSNLTNPPQQ